MIMENKNLPIPIKDIKEDIKEKINTPIPKNKVLKKILGAVLLCLGIIFFITPFTPGAIWLIVVGLQLLGLHFLFWYRVKDHALQIKEKKEHH